VIGGLKHRIVLEERVRAADGGGGGTETWTPVATLWASLKQTSGRERDAADRVAPRTLADITIRYRPDVTTDMRFRQGTRFFNIRSVLDKDGRKRWLTCHCEEGSLS
jgi:SPP1 family predicted phage head-tail adaptor